MAFVIALLLVLAMVLLDFVVIITSQRDLINTEISKGRLVLATIEAYLNQARQAESAIKPQIFQAPLMDIVNTAGYSCLSVQDTKGNPIVIPAKGCAVGDQLQELTTGALQTRQPQVHYDGSTWGVFWRQKEHLFVVAPLRHKDSIIGSAGIHYHLERVYHAMRRSQQIIGIYILINTLLLTLIGIYRLSKIFLQPINRLVRQAEEYREDGGLFFPARKADNEFVQLSKSLNQMINRISEDKSTLRSTVSSLEQANIDLKQAQKEIIQAEKLASVGRLSSGIAHEIGNPIGIVLGYLDLIKQADVPDAEKHEFIERAEKEINRINTIIRQLLDFSRPSKKGMEVVAAHDIIADVLTVLKVQPMLANIELKRHLQAEHDTVYADPNQLRQVFLNLMINAADAIASQEEQESGIIIITSEQLSGTADGMDDSRDWFKVVFSDNGPGIPADQLDNIFDPFYTTKEPGKGTGLGLSVSFMIIENSGGTIKAESQKGQGTQIAVYLPLRIGASVPD